jgi:hypothetical protein
MAIPSRFPLATGVQVETSPDGKVTALLFKVKDDPGVVPVALAPRELSRLVGLMLAQAGEVAARNAPERPPEELRVTPVMASQLGVAQGRSDTEALMTFRVGNLDLTFAIELAQLVAQCERLQEMVVQSAPDPPQ